METDKMQEIRISVRGLVEFILRHGDIDNRHKAAPDNAMQEGGRIHRMIQRRMGAEYQAEVPLKYTYATESYVLVVEGRADGIIHQGDRVTIDEIKGTYRDLARINGPALLHLAQARCYGYMYGIQKGLKEIQVRITYCNIPTEGVRYFHENYVFEELEAWFQDLVAAYRKWADYTWKWREIRQESIKELSFPFPYRQGQRDLVGSVYRTIYHGKKLFLEAPTGVGKTISTLFPSIQAVGKGMGEKIFYLTAKTITRTVADDALNLLRENGLRMKSILLTAKEKICFMDETECNPIYCPYARGHYDRVNEAVFDLITTEERFSRDRLETYARKYNVCPFEMGLDVSLYADAVICDYNYLFDPHVYLKRFFSEGTEGNYIFLVDEAHNLLERGREMYSAAMGKKQFMELRKELKKTIVSETHISRKNKGISGQIELNMTLDMTRDLTLLSEMEEMTETEEEGRPGKRGYGGSEEPAETEQEEEYAAGRALQGGRSILVRRGYADRLVYHLTKCNRELLVLKRECEKYRIVDSIEAFVQNLTRLHTVMEDYLAEQEDRPLEIGEMLLDFYFDVCHFLFIYELVDENYVKYTRTEEDGSFLVKLFCVNPHENLKKCMMRGRSTILFSATLLPIQYYKRLLGGEAGDYEVYAQSIFNPSKRALMIAGDVTSRYTRRSEDEYCKIAQYIEEIVKNRHGNYMVFCPSYAFMKQVHEKYVDNFVRKDRICILQGESMSEADREAFLACFRNEGQERMLIGFCVLGGIFSEGIDQKRDSLIGVIIVGTGLPQVSSENEILKSYFDCSGEDGFDYAFRYPGINKVLQAAGRVIRTAEDVGIIALLDERFLQYSYYRLFPREWEDFQTVSVNTVAKRVERFWDEWL